MSRISFGKPLCWTVISVVLAIGASVYATDQVRDSKVPLGAVEKESQPSSDWLARITSDIKRAEYQFSRQEDGSLSAPNRVHDLRASLDESGLRVTSRTKGGNPKDGGWELRLLLSAQGRQDSLAEVPSAHAEVTGDKAELRRGRLAEWYRNDEKGLEQGFTLDAPPAGPSGSPVVVEMTLSGSLSAYPSEDGQEILFKTATEEAALRYSAVRVEDARGSIIQARLVVRSNRLQIQFSDDGAAYPLIVDPLMTSPAWTVQGNQALAAFGFSLGTAGDVNGDGYSDVIVGSYGYDNGQTDEGRVYVYLGSASGPATSPSSTLEIDQTGAEFGYSVGTAGDVNGDGYSDVIISSPVANNFLGGAWVYHGSASGITTPAAWSVTSDQSVTYFGIRCGTAGDVNGDGYSDVIVGEHSYSKAGFGVVGRALVYHGSASGLGTSPAWTAVGDSLNAAFGYAVGTAGDVNGDGFSDVIVGKIGTSSPPIAGGRAYVYHGSSAGLATTASWTGQSDQDSSLFGFRVATAGDVNGDGFSDVIVTAPDYDNGQTNEGRAFVFHGSSSGLSTSAAWTFETDQASAGDFIMIGATAGDVNGDGYSDVIVGAAFYDNGQTDEGFAWVFNGSSSGLSNTASWTAEGNQAGAEFGTWVGTAGDVNGDGFSDVIVSAPTYDYNTSTEGRAYVFEGSATGLATSSSWTAESDQASAEFGLTAASAGDINGDGYSDVIVGAHLYDNGQTNEGRAFVFHGSASGLSATPVWTAESNQASAEFGISVASAGDVNGDGFSDVIVGAHLYDNGQNNEGRAFVYHGSPTGLASSAAWTAESNQVSAEFGRSVAGAGDVNGDGFSDVVVGAHLYDNGQTNEGRAFVYHGSSSGLSTTANWTAESNQASAELGISVASAADVNGDGFSDVVVGAHLYDNGQTNEGRAFVYHGSSSGVSTTANWTAESNQASAEFGRSVASAGDVNGDGYSDVIVGAHIYDNGQTDEGRAFVYHGSSTGLATSAAWTAEGDQASADFAFSVASAGDVNGDGYSDVIVGAHLYDNVVANRGRALVYHGSGSGLSATPAWTAESNQSSSEFGIAVASAGDVNGDGYGDVIVGSSLFDNGQTNEGRAFVYYGNGGPGLSRIPNQFKLSGAPLALLGKSDSSTSFHLHALGRTPGGRGKVRLEWEVKPLGTAFNGAGLGQGSFVDTGFPGASGSVASLDDAVTGLTSGTVYKWRLRIASGDPYFQHSAWFSLPYNGRTESDLRTP